MARLSLLGRTARDYARQGFSVLPLQERGKAPITPHGHKDATTEPDLIRHWWETREEANIGLAIPRGLVVVDLDDPAALLRLRAEDRDLPATAKSVTARGFHFFHRTQTEIRNAVRLPPGVDLRGVGGYVVVPPSIHPTGVRYRWEVPLSQSSIADAPAWLGEAVSERGTNRARTAEEWRHLTAGGVGEGERNNAIASLAGHLLQRRVDPFVVLDLMLSWNAARCRPPLSGAEVTRTVDSIAGWELRRRESLA